MKICAADGCKREVEKWRKHCSMHHQRLRNKGHLYSGRELAISRFFSKVRFAENGCWLWEGLRQRGYGVFNDKGIAVRAHRWAYEYFYGPVPDGKILDHYECSNRGCVNPTHVRPVSHRENLLRSDTSAAAVNTAKDVCKNGHPLRGYNLVWLNPGPYRGCRACRNEAARRYAERNKDRAHKGG